MERHASSRVIGSFFATVFDHGLARADGLAEVAAQREADPAEVLDGEPDR